KWEPGVIPVKPELTAAPIWLELRNMPFQFFNEDALERIASLVGDPKFLHPSTKNKTNLEVAKVFTVIDPRKPLPEAVNVQFDSGEICRVLVSSPWMPPICSICKGIGHSSRKCKMAPITCIPCNSTTHGTHNCPKASGPVDNGKGRRTRRAKPKEKPKEMRWAVVDVASNYPLVPPAPSITTQASGIIKLGTASDFVVGETSKSLPPPQVPRADSPTRKLSSEISSAVDSDSSDVESSEEEEGEILDMEKDFTLVRKKQFSKLKNTRGKGPNLN
ncbi:hypothetical protein BRARA_J00919, partial [Brassica rapa]